MSTATRRCVRPTVGYSAHLAGRNGGMVRRTPAAALLALALTAATLGGTRAQAEGEPAPAAVQIEQDRSEVSLLIGERFSFTSTVRAPAAVSGLIAHLNIVSLDPETYVDPEDWSDERTQYLPDIPAGAQVTLPWNVQAVNDGSFVVYVALAHGDAGQPVQAGPGLRAQVTAQRVINPGGMLPIAAAVPASLLALMFATRLRRRRRS